MTAAERLERLVQAFASAPNDVRLQALLDYSRRLPDFPERFADHPELMERVPECQTPFVLVVEGDGEVIRLHFSVPPESPTVRGFAGILHDALNGATAAEILEVPDDFYQQMGLQETISGMRLRGMDSILRRLKRRVAELQEAA